MHRVRRKVTKWGHTSGGNRHPFAKPDWERAAIFDLHATLPQAGCRSLANQFNAIHADLGFSVSKTWVSELLRQRRHALASSRRRSVAVSRSEPIQRVWGIDLTGLPIKTGESLPVWGVIEHGSRAVLQLEPVMRFNSLILLGKLLIAFGTFGLPRAIRSDNDAVFKTWAFRLMLKVLGVKQQFTALHSPWQNGRIERFWRTMKEALGTQPKRFREGLRMIEEQMRFASAQAMQEVLRCFKDFYNFSRPHQLLDNQTPAQVWHIQIEKIRTGEPATSLQATLNTAKQRRAS